MTEILILYYSRNGATESLAREVARGVDAVGISTDAEIGQLDTPDERFGVGGQVGRPDDQRGFALLVAVDQTGGRAGAFDALDRNPNEKLLLEALFWSLPDAQGVGTWLDGWLFAQSGPIYAGTNEIQRSGQVHPERGKQEKHPLPSPQIVCNGPEHRGHQHDGQAGQGINQTQPEGTLGHRNAGVPVLLEEYREKSGNDDGCKCRVCPVVHCPGEFLPGQPRPDLHR